MDIPEDYLPFKNYNLEKGFAGVYCICLLHPNFAFRNPPLAKIYVGETIRDTRIYEHQLYITKKIFIRENSGLINDVHYFKWRYFYVYIPESYNTENMSNEQKIELKNSLEIREKHYISEYENAGIITYNNSKPESHLKCFVCPTAIFKPRNYGIEEMQQVYFLRKDSRKFTNLAENSVPFCDKHALEYLERKNKIP